MRHLCLVFLVCAVLCVLHWLAFNNICSIKKNNKKLADQFTAGGAYFSMVLTVCYVGLFRSFFVVPTQLCFCCGLSGVVLLICIS